MAKNTTLTHPISDKAYLLVSAGEITANGNALKAGDGAAIEHTDSLQLSGNNRLRSIGDSALTTATHREIEPYNAGNN